MLGLNVPPRPRNHHHPQGLRGQVRRRADRIPDDIRIPVADGKMWPPVNLGGNTPLMPNRFQEILDLSSPGFRSPYDLSYDQPCRDPYAQAIPRRAGVRNMPITFPRAMQMLSDELDSAMKYCREVERQFSGETYDMAVWADDQSLDLLWAKKLDWNGVLAFESARDPSIRPPSTVITYNMVVENLHDAFDNVHRCPMPSAPDIAALDNPQITPESFVTTMRKLDASSEEIEELLETVRSHRNRMNALRKELSSAHKLLDNIRELWAPRKQVVRQQRMRDEYAWEEY